MSTRPQRAMVLAAGLGLRMRPITLETPKPLVTVAGRTMLDRALDHLAEAGVEQVVVNCHWLADKIKAHLDGRSGVAVVDEDVLLETGGGVANALPLLGNQPFYVINGDIIWTNGAEPALSRLASAWTDSMDAVLLMQPTARAVGYEGAGDFFVDSNGCPRRRQGSQVAPTLFAGVQILHPRLFKGAPSGKFSLNVLYDRALEQGRLLGLVHDGGWYHVGTPEALPEVEALLAER